MNRAAINRAARCALAVDVYESFMAETETLNELPLAMDLAYLLGAIVRGENVEWNEDQNEHALRILREVYTEAHQVWAHVVIAGAAPCGPDCPGWAVFNEGEGDPDDLGDVQACDECGRYTDDEAADLARAAGYTVEWDEDGSGYYVTAKPAEVAP